MATEIFTSRLGNSKAFPLFPLYEGDHEQEEGAELRRDLQLHKAHLVMLVEQDIIPRDVGKAIMAELLNLEMLGLKGLELDRSLGLYLSTEKYLVDKLGADVAGKLHTARSRNDLDPANRRMHLRESIRQVIASILELKKVLLEQAEKHTDTVMPGYTHHSQHAQPITYAHYLMCAHDALSRDITRLEQAFAVVNLSPLGGCALAGTGFPVNRDRVAELLGFDGLVENTIDATGLYDYILQFVSALAIAMSNLGRMGEGIYLWNTAEFGMVEMAPQYCSISSIMPQKKNPVAMEMIRGEATLVANRLNAMMGVLKAIPPGGGREYHYMEWNIQPCVNSVVNCMATMGGMLSTLKINKDVMLHRAAEGFGAVTELADEIVRRTGLSFRHAHHIVGRLCNDAIQTGKKSNEITSAMVDAAAREIISRPLGLAENVVQNALNPVENVRLRETKGGPAPREVRRMIENRKNVLLQDQERVAQRECKLEETARMLRDVCKRLMES